MDEHEREELAGLASALTGDAAAAAELLGEVVALPERYRTEEEDGGHPGRAVLVHRFLRTRPDPDLAAAERPDLGPELEPVRARLYRLPPLERAVLVLRHREQLTLGELVRLTGRKPAVVTEALAAAGGAVDAAQHELDQVLQASPRPEVWAVVAAGRRATTRRRRTHGRVLLACLAAVSIVVAATVVPGLLRPDPYLRASGEWVYGFALEANEEFTPSGRSLSPTEDVLSVARRDRDGNCTVTLTTTPPAAEREPVPEGRGLQVADRPARLVAATDTSYASLWWSVGPRTSGLAQCDGKAEEQVLIRLAGLVRYGPSAVQLPFTFRGLPPDDEVRLLFDSAGGSGAMLTPRGQLDDSADTVYVGVPSFFDRPQGSPTREIPVDGTRAQVYSDTEGQSVCWRPDRHTACVAASPLQSPTARQRRHVLDHVIATAQLLHLAADLDDRATWFDAAATLPH